MDSISKLHYNDSGFVLYTKLISFRNKNSKIHQQTRAVGGRTPAAKRASKQTTETFYICGTSRGDASSGRPGNDGVLQKWRRHYLRSHHNEHGINNNKIKKIAISFHLLFNKDKCKVFTTFDCLLTFYTCTCKIDKRMICDWYMHVCKATYCTSICHITFIDSFRFQIYFTMLRWEMQLTS